MACCLTAPSHHLNQCWLIVSKVLWYSPEGIIMKKKSEDKKQLNKSGNYIFRIIFRSPRANELRVDTWLGAPSLTIWVNFIIIFLVFLSLRTSKVTSTAKLSRCLSNLRVIARSWRRGAMIKTIIGHWTTYINKKSRTKCFQQLQFWWLVVVLGLNVVLVAWDGLGWLLRHVVLGMIRVMCKKWVVENVCITNVAYILHIHIYIYNTYFDA